MGRGKLVSAKLKKICVELSWKEILDCQGEKNQYYCVGCKTPDCKLQRIMQAVKNCMYLVEEIEKEVK